MRALLQQLEGRYTNLSGDEVIAQMDREDAERKRQLEGFTAAVKKAIRAKGTFQVGNWFPQGRTVIHKSSRPGVAYQVTFLQRGEPTGHSDARSLDAAIKRAWEDVPPKAKTKYAKP